MADISLPEQGFEDPTFLNTHIRSILDFYENRSIDVRGGFYHTFRDNGDIYDPGLRHLVSSARFVHNYALAYCHLGDLGYRERARHGLDFLKNHHRQPPGHYAWELRDGVVTDGRALAYGHAFVLLAAASALRAGLDEARALIQETWEFLETYFWQDEYGAYADERDQSLQNLNSYRGQNANMHLCEALLATWEVTGETRYMDRAQQLAHRFVGELAEQSGGLIWEHYSPEWQVDLDYNRDKPDDMYKPWGFQSGHQIEWAKLLLQLNSHRPSLWLVNRAVELYHAAMERGWDKKYGGLVYGFSPDGSFCDASKHFWVQAEAIATAWRLYRQTGEQRYLEDYRKLWSWSWQYLVDHQYGAWFRIRTRQGAPVDDIKSPPGKTDYHTLGACWDVLSKQAAEG